MAKLGRYQAGLVQARETATPRVGAAVVLLLLLALAQAAQRHGRRACVLVACAAGCAGLLALVWRGPFDLALPGRLTPERQLGELVAPEPEHAAMDLRGDDD